MKKLTAATLFCLFFLFAKADTFIVTSNADSGPGTFREAITLAKANGTSVADKIEFNLPELTSTGRRIVLLSELPELTSNMTIDASTQPGVKFGVSDAKVELYFNYSTNTSQSVFKIYNCTNVGIYAIKITDNIEWTAWYKETTCIRIENSSNVEIGNVGKGNVIINWIHAIVGQAGAGTANEFSYNKNLRFYSNFLGLDDDGKTAVGDGDLMVFSRIENIEIGNMNPLSGNVLAATRKRIAIGGTKGKILIANNKIGTDYTGTTMLSMPYGESDHLFDNIHVANSPWYYEVEYETDVKIINNLSTGNCGGGIYLVGVGRKFYIQGNKIGTDITGTKRLSPLMDYGIWVSNCRDGIIGVENDEVAEKNIIAFAQEGSSGAGGSGGRGILIHGCPSGITISRNSIFCDQKTGIYHPPGGAHVIPEVAINAVSPNSVSGTAPPLSKIELFRDDSCINCEGKIFFDVTYADANGKWSKTNINTQGIVVTATDTSRMTSEFSAPKYSYNNFRIQNAQCGQKNGSIKGINITSGTWWHWEDDSGNVVGSDTSLVNVGPGRYRLVVGIGNNSCKEMTEYYEITDVTPPESVSPLINASSCGLANGSIYINYDYDRFRGSWLNSRKDSIGSDNHIQNLLPGSYYFRLSVQADATCTKLYGPFIVQNQSGPTLQTNSVQIAPAICSGKNGSIKGITAINMTGTPQLWWVDSSNKVISTGYQLYDMPAGKYRLKFKDASGCDTIITPFYTIENTGSITIDTASKVITPAKCSGNTGSIQNIKITGGESYEWKNSVTGIVAGNTPDLFNLSAGPYQLTVTNRFGCSQVLPPVTVAQTTYDDVGALDWHSIFTTCGQANGSIEVTRFRKDTSHYAFRWVDSASNQTIARYSRIYNLDSGTYMLFAKDSNGCEQQIIKTRLISLPVLYFDYANLRITPDKCLAGEGTITGIVVKDMQGTGGTYKWLNSANVSIGSTLNIQNVRQDVYHLQVTDGRGCTAVSRPVMVDNINIALPAPQYDEQTILKNTAATLMVKNGRSGTHLLFDDASGMTLLQENTTGIFTTPVLTADKVFYVRYVKGACASNLLAVSVKVIDKTAVYVPTAFTPNSDGKNDVLKAIPYGKVKLIHFTIYNRWGQVIFSTENFSKGWNGTIQGQPVESGVYVWLLKAVDEVSGKGIDQKGTVTVIW
jgi:gliding motility-associated-like protein